MSDVAETIRDGVKQAMRDRDAARRDALRLIVSAIDNARIEARHDLDDDEVVRVLQKEAKQRRDSIEEYGKAGRDDLVASEQAELDIINEFLPAGLTPEELAALVDETIAEVGAAGPDDLGKVMGPLMGKIAGRADGREANTLVRERLAG
jgi:uncharacterized protein YqeY